MAALLFIICNVDLPPHTLVTLTNLQDPLSQLPAPFLLLGDFIAWHHLGIVWMKVKEDAFREIYIHISP
jgi:hypothetical protein